MPAAASVEFGQWYWSQRHYDAVFRLIGWTRTGHSVILQRVPWLPFTRSLSHEKSIDLEWLATNHVAAPIHAAKEYRPVLDPQIVVELKREMSADVATLVCSYFAPPSDQPAIHYEPYHSAAASFGTKKRRYHPC